MNTDQTVNVRYMVDNVATALDFYTTPPRAQGAARRPTGIRRREPGNLRLLLSCPDSSAGRAVPDGARPEAGGWNRIHFVTSDNPPQRGWSDVP